MENARRWYTYLTSAISLNAILWAAISLLRTLFSDSVTDTRSDLALTMSILIIAVPIYLLHWRAAQKTAAASLEDRASVQRSLYLYAALGYSLGPILVNLFSLILHGILDSRANTWSSSLSAILVMAVSFAYHHRGLKTDQQTLGQAASPEVRRLYNLAFLTAGLVMLISAGLTLIGWMLYRLPPSAPEFSIWMGQVGNLGLQSVLLRLVFGLAIFVYFWRALQYLFSSSQEEQGSLLRAVYLYLLVFIATVTTVSTASAILAGWLRRLLGLSRQGDVRELLPVLIVFGALWAFFGLVLQKGHPESMPSASQARARRIYHYLVAAVGFGALLVGLVGNLNSLLSSLVYNQLGAISLGTRASFATYTATLLAGLATWALPWRVVQAQAEAAGDSGAQSRRATVRKAYLYFFLFISMMTLLGFLVSIVYAGFLLLLGQSSFAEFLRDLVIPVSDTLVAAGVLIFHGWLLRGDQHRLEAEKTTQLKDLRLTILDDGDGTLAAALKTRLEDNYPGLDATLVGLSLAARKALGTKVQQAGILSRIKNSGLIITPWSAATSLEKAPPKTAQAIAESRAHKLFLPLRREGVDWVGLPALSPEDWITQTMAALKQYLEGEEVIAKRPLGCLAIFGLLVLALMVLSILGSLIFA